MYVRNMYTYLPVLYWLMGSTYEKTRISIKSPFNTLGTKEQVSAHSFAGFFVCGMMGKF